MIILIMAVVLALVYYFHFHQPNEGFTDTECPLEYVNLVPAPDGKYHLILKLKTRETEEPPKVFSTKEDAVKFWKFLKLNNTNMQNCTYPFEHDIKSQAGNAPDPSTGLPLRKKVKQIAQEARDTYQKLVELNNKLERDGDLESVDHETVGDLADKTVDHAKGLRDSALKSEDKKAHINTRLSDVNSDQAALGNIAKTDEADAVELSLKINEAKFRLVNHADRLARLEDRINSVNSCINANKTVLSDIKSKLNNVASAAAPTPVPTPISTSTSSASVPANVKQVTNTDTKRLQVNRTVQTIDSSLAKCPPCPMYAATYPVDVLEVERQKVGTLVPLSQSLGIKVD